MLCLGYVCVVWKHAKKNFGIARKERAAMSKRSSLTPLFVVVFVSFVSKPIIPPRFVVIVPISRSSLKSAFLFVAECFISHAVMLLSCALLVSHSTT